MANFPFGLGLHPYKIQLTQELKPEDHGHYTQIGLLNNKPLMLIVEQYIRERWDPFDALW